MLFELLQVALGNQEKLSHNPTEEEWTELLDDVQKQAVTGFTFVALEKLTTYGQKPPFNILCEWIGLSEQIRSQNIILNKRCVEVVQLFKEAGFRSCILKGQGNALLYPEPLLRTSGDIDLWVEGNRRDIRNYVMSKSNEAQDGDMHIDLPVFDETPVEVHYFPSFNSIPHYNKKLQKWFEDNSEEQFSNHVSLLGITDNSVCIPTARFNVVQQMSHIMVHFFVEGIGFRQFVDYYFLLKKLHEAKYDDDFEAIFKQLGMLKFACGVMWVEKNILGLNDAYLIVSPNAKIGKIILKEIVEGGNFGFHDQRYSAREKGYLMRGVVDTYRLLQLLFYFPKDVLWKIIDKIKNQRWKLKK